MKGKLIKTSNGIYDLFEGTRFISTTDSPDGTANKLSLKNCQAIELSYDLEELADEFAKTKSSHSTFQNTHKRDFREGFQKALELMGDKKFSEFLDKEKELGISDIKTIERIQWYYNTYFDKSQQTEWDVEIEMENVMHDYNGNISLGAKFKLDADGCLILKLKSE